MPPLSRYDLATAVEDRLKDIANLTVYRSEIPQTPATLSPNDQRVAAYAVLWPTPGSQIATDSPLKGRVDDDVLWRFLVTCVHGVSTGCERTIDAVLASLNGWEPEVPSFSTSSCSLDYDPGPIRAERSPLPARYVLPLPFVIRLGY